MLEVKLGSLKEIATACQWCFSTATKPYIAPSESILSGYLGGGCLPTYRKSTRMLLCKRNPGIVDRQVQLGCPES